MHRSQIGGNKCITGMSLSSSQTEQEEEMRGQVEIKPG